MIGLANGGDDTINAVKQAAEFGITRGGQKLAGLVIVISIVHGLGLEIARGLVFTESFYWDMNEATRAWSKRFFALAGRMPGMVQAGTYSSVMHYLKSMRAAGTTEGAAVAAQMHALPVDDFFAKGRVREDGRLLHDFFLAEVKTPSSPLRRGTTTRYVASSRRRRRPSRSRNRSARSSGSNAPQHGSLPPCTYVERGPAAQGVGIVGAVQANGCAVDQLDPQLILVRRRSPHTLRIVFQFAPGREHRRL